jgi:hypothetical protein
MASTSPRDPVFELKALASALQIQAKAANKPIARAQALEAVAHRHGYKDWNAAVAAAKADVLASPAAPEEATVALIDWQNLDVALPQLPMRITPAGDVMRANLLELLRWARQLDYIGTKAPEDDRHDLIANIGGEVPYVFVQDAHRFGTKLFYLCDRGYEEIDGVAFTSEQLALCGVVAWQKQRGTHNGYSMFSVVDDSLRMDGSDTELRQAARVLANISLLADHLGSPLSRP